MEETAIKNLKRIFENSTRDEMSLDEIYRAVGFDMNKPKTNRMWIGNRLIAFKKYELADPIYATKNNSKALDKIRLTEKGKAALGRANTEQSLPHIEEPEQVQVKETNGHAINNKVKISLEDVMKVIPRLKQEHPDFEITFDVRLKTG